MPKRHDGNSIHRHTAECRICQELPFGFRGAYLDTTLLPRDEVKQKIQDAVAMAKRSGRESSKSFPEGAFLNEFAIRGIHEFLKAKHNLSSDQAGRALLSESYRSLLEFASWTPASEFKHPFTKALGATAKSVIAQWCPARRRFPLFLNAALTWRCELRVNLRLFLRPSTSGMVGPTLPGQL